MQLISLLMSLQARDRIFFESDSGNKLYQQLDKNKSILRYFKLLINK